MNKFFLSLLTLTTLSSTTVFADIFPENSEGKGIWQLSVAGEYVIQQPNALPYVTAFETTTSHINAPVVTEFPMLHGDPDKEWAYQIELGYVLPSHLYDIRASYFNLSSAKNSTFIGTLPDSLTVISTVADETFDYATADINTGIYSDFFTERLMLRMGVGVVYVDINQHGTGNFQDLTHRTISGTNSIENRFHGIGPEITLDGNFALNDYFAVVAGIGVSLPIGKSKVRVNMQEDIESSSTPRSIHSEVNDTHVALGVEGKVGLRYMQNVSENWAINIEAGYQGVTYQHALQEGPALVPVSSVALGASALPAPLPPATVDYQGNYYNYGPYIELGVDFW